MAQENQCDVILHAGDFGFYDETSYTRLSLRELRTCIQYAPIDSETRSKLLRTDDKDLRKEAGQVQLSELPLFLTGEKSFAKPIYVVWGNQEDIVVLEKFQSGQYSVPNLILVDENASVKLPCGTIRLFGLGGTVYFNRMFDYGEGVKIPGKEGIIWTSILQLGKLLETAESAGSGEMRILLSHSSPAKEPMLSRIAYSIKADYVVSGGLHFRYSNVFNDFSVTTKEIMDITMESCRNDLTTVLSHVKEVLDAELNEHEKELLKKVVNCFHSGISEEAMKNLWNINLSDYCHGHAILRIEEGNRFSLETKSSGVSLAHKLRTNQTTSRQYNKRGNSAKILFLGGGPMNLTKEEIEQFWGVKILRIQEFSTRADKSVSNYRIQLESESDAAKVIKNSPKEYFGTPIRIDIFRG